MPSALTPLGLASTSASFFMDSTAFLSSELFFQAVLMVLELKNQAINQLYVFPQLCVCVLTNLCLTSTDLLSIFHTP